MRRTRQQNEQGRGGLGTPTNELATSQLPKRPDPEIAIGRILAACERFLKVYPELAVILTTRVQELCERYRLPRTTPTLNVSQASRLAGVSRVRLRELHERGRMGQRVEGRLMFTEKECLAWKNRPARERRPGR